MRINEITVSDSDLTFDILKDNIAAKVHTQYKRIEDRSGGFIVSAIDSYDPGDLADLIEEFQGIFRIVKPVFEPTTQTYQLVTYLTNYLTDK